MAAAGLRLPTAPCAHFLPCPSLDAGRPAKRAKLTHSRLPLSAAPVADIYDAEDLDRDADRYMRRTLPAPILSRDQILANLEASVHDTARQHYQAFFSSELGGIVVDPAMMGIHIDDHMVHRGHSVFDTCEVVRGHLYCLDEHFKRFLNSAALAGIQLSMTQAQMYRAILETAAASEKMDCHLRFWLSAGRGGFGLTTKECLWSSFYVMAYTVPDPPPPQVPHLEGIKACSSPVPVKDPFSATVKSTNYLINALNLQHAERMGFDQGIFVTEDDYVLEGPNMNLGILTYDNEFIVPPFEQTLAGITMKRLLEMLPVYADGGVLNISGISRRYFTKYEAQQAKEVVLTGSSIRVRGITQWDGITIGTGSVGDHTMCMHGIISEDMEREELLTPVPYGFLTFSGDWEDPS